MTTLTEFTRTLVGIAGAVLLATASLTAATAPALAFPASPVATQVA